ncbi:thioesterase domain-containing protein [Pelagicoccus sp. SDUM812002]|uniref:thioesterase II family protein n=1 Tax=Pelagicoccus sp. SDUM812002 TaxID=3041266 RepID=UPI0028101BC4|nr:thioesterase domain-containing protein [Pelagicoccus sp. SDUM812002]MDQ8188595.1 thioesterase domain-containing protein [Pelagicoccus sp. SDUM812002]
MRREFSKNTIISRSIRSVPPLLRLFCFPHAGGGASMFNDWQHALPPQVELCAIQLPGRENRVREVPHRHMNPLVESIVCELDDLMDLPFAFFGHSMGASLIFEMTRHLRRSGRPQPVHLYVSGCKDPSNDSNDDLIRSDLPEPQFIAYLKEIGGTPEEVFESKELLKIMLPVLRADFEVLETYEHIVERPLECPITAFSGADDEIVTSEDMQEWRKHTNGNFRLKIFPGGHFFVRDAKNQVISELSISLGSVMAENGQV